MILKELDSPTVPTAPPIRWDMSRVRRQASSGRRGGYDGVAAAAALCPTPCRPLPPLRRKLDVKLFSHLHHEVKNKTLGQKLRRANKGLLITMPVASFHFTESVYAGSEADLCPPERVGPGAPGHQCGGERGKSTVCANIALTLAQRNKKVLSSTPTSAAAQYKLFDGSRSGSWPICWRANPL